MSPPHTNNFSANQGNCELSFQQQIYQEPSPSRIICLKRSSTFPIFYQINVVYLLSLYIGMYPVSFIENVSFLKYFLLKFWPIYFLWLIYRPTVPYQVLLKMWSHSLERVGVPQFWPCSRSHCTCSLPFSVLPLFSVRLFPVFCSVSFCSLSSCSLSSCACPPILLFPLLLFLVRLFSVPLFNQCFGSCGSGSRIPKMSIWIQIQGGKH